MKILILHYNKGFHGGAEEVVTQIAKASTLAGHDIRVIDESNPAKLMREGKKWLSWCDIINAHNFPATLATLGTTKPIVWICNEPPEMFTNLIRKPLEMINRAWVRYSQTAVIVASEEDAIRFTSIYNHNVDAIIPYGTDVDFFSEGARQPLEDTFTILHVGYICRSKNQLASVRALAKVRHYLPNARLIIVGTVGESWYMERVKQEIKNLELYNYVGFTGGINKYELRDLYKTSDVLVQPLKECQGGWLVPFEAIAAGLPVIVSDKFAGRDLIINHNLGMVIPLERLPEAIGSVRWMDGKQKEQVPKAQKWVCENLTWKKYTDKVLNIFEEMI